MLWNHAWRATLGSHDAQKERDQSSVAENEGGVNEVMFLASISQSQKLTSATGKSGKRCWAFL